MKSNITIDQNELNQLIIYYLSRRGMQGHITIEYFFGTARISDLSVEITHEDIEDSSVRSRMTKPPHDELNYL